MTIVRNTLSDPGQAATVNRPITVRLASAGFRPGDESQIVSTATVRSDAAGSYELDLVPNSQIDPAGTHYVITHPDGTLWPIVVPDGSGPFWLRDILVEDPAAPGAVIAGLTEQTASVLLAPKLDAADLAVSVADEIDTPGSAVDLSLRAASRALVAADIVDTSSAIGAAAGAMVGAATNYGVALTKMTSTALASYTPRLGETVYKTDTRTFVTGDGTTVGGNASDCGFSTQQLIRLGFIKPRHTRWLPQAHHAIATNVQNDIPKPIVVGDSITVGDGASNSSIYPWYIVLGAKLKAWAGTTSAAWQPTMYAVSGSTTATSLDFLADVMDPATQRPIRSAAMTSTPPLPTAAKLITLSDGRNDATYLTVSDYAMLTRLGLQQIKRHGADPLFIIENPMINGTTGAYLDNAANWTPYYQAALEVTSEENASLVDTWGYFNMLAQFGINLLDFITTDGVHPNDAGHALYASLIFRCMTAGPDAAARFHDRAMTDGRSHVYANYTPLPGPATTVINTGGLTGPLSNQTARQVQRGETNATATVYLLAAGGTISFRTPGPIRGVFVHFLADSHSTGRPSLSLNGAATIQPVTSGARWDGYRADGITTLPMINYATTRQFDHYFSTKDQAGTLVDDRPGVLTITANGGQVAVLGVTFVTAGTDMHPLWADTASNVGSTWGPSTFTDNGEVARVSGTALDYDTITFYGTSISADFETGPAAGRYNVSVDGGAAGADVELWTTIGNVARRPVTLAKNLPVGWHTVTIAISATRSVNSTGYNVKYGRVAVERGTPDPTVGYMPLASGEVMPLGESWQYAAIERVISGTPVVMFSPKASSITVTGGAAVVRLTR